MADIYVYAYVEDEPTKAVLKCMPSEPQGEGDIAVELWKKIEPGEK